MSLTPSCLKIRPYSIKVTFESASVTILFQHCSPSSQCAIQGVYESLSIGFLEDQQNS